MIERVVPNPSYSQASFVSLLIGFDFELDVSGNLVLTRRQSLDHEVLPSTNIRSIEVIAHENVNFIEDVFTFTGSYNIWHYRDPDQIQVRWENVTGKPAAASTEEMTLGTETSIRLMSPALVHQARPTQATETEMIAGTEAEVRSYSPLNIREASHYRGVYAATVTYQSGNVVFHDDVFWMARIATTGNEPLISAHQHWARSGGDHARRQSATRHQRHPQAYSARHHVDRATLWAGRSSVRVRSRAQVRTAKFVWHRFAFRAVPFYH